MVRRLHSCEMHLRRVQKAVFGIPVLTSQAVSVVLSVQKLRPKSVGGPPLEHVCKSCTPTPPSSRSLEKLSRALLLPEKAYFYYDRRVSFGS